MAANRIKGITIELNGDTTKLQTALKDTDKQISKTQGYLKDLDKLLKLDPGNVELLTQKEKYLNQEIEATKERLKELKGVSKDSLTPDEWDALQREIADTEQKLEGLEQDYKDFGSVAKQQVQAVADEMGKIGEKMAGAGDSLTMKVSLPIVGAMGGAVKTAADFEQSLAKVEAVSGATAEDMVLIKDKAAELGENTKFSASEVADAFNYMAMAGWNVDQMLAGVDGILNLSAADGLDLAATSDIVTDAITAFGLSAEDAGHFADVMAKASSSANTNVSMLGESFKYVAPVAGSLGYSAEDTAIALGLMANSGIKASQAGTALRTILTNLSKPTKQMYQYMDDLGISLTDSDGNMLSMGELMTDLRKKMSLTTEQQVALNYISEQGEELMGHLADGWENMTDTEQKYNTEVSVGTRLIEGMTSSELKQMAAQELGISLGKDRNLTAEEYDQLAQKLGQDTLNGLTRSEQAAAAAAIFGKNAMAGGLAIINATDEDYASLTESIYGAEGAAQEMADIMMGTLEGNLTQLKSKVEALAISFGDILLPVVSDVVDFLKDGIDWLNGLPDDTKTIVTQAGLIAAAIGPILSIGGRILEGMGLIMTHPLIAGGLLLGGLLAAAIMDAYEHTEKWGDYTRTTSDELEALNERIDASRDALDKAREARENSIEKIESEWDHTEKLKKELDGLVDENGRVKKGYENRAKFIVGKLADALDLEIEYNDGIIEGYQDISEEIDNMIETKKRAAIMAAFEEEYQTAVKNSTQAQKNLSDAVEYARQVSSNYNTQRRKVYDLEMAINAVNKDGVDIQAALNGLGEVGRQIWAEYYEEGDTGYEITKKLTAAYEDEADTLSTMEDEYVVATEAVANADQTYQDYQHTIEHYEGAMEAAAASDTEGVTKHLDELKAGYQGAATEYEKSLQKMVTDAEREYENLKKAHADGEAGVTQEQVNAACLRLQQAQKDLADYRNEVTNAFEKLPSEAATAMNKNVSQVNSAGKTLGANAVSGMAADLAQADAYGSSYAGHYGSGIINNAQAGYNGARYLVGKANEAASDNSGADNAGSLWGEGYYNGMERWRKHVADKAFQIATEAVQSANYAQISRSPSRAMMKTGRYFGEGYEIGIESEESAVKKAAAGLAETAMGATADASANFGGVYTASGSGGRAANVDNRSVTYGATNIQIYAQPGMDVNQLADAVQNRLALLQRQREAAFA